MILLNINELVTAISTVGFPIVMCGALLKLGYVLLDKIDKELDSLRTTINNNTTVMQRILDKLRIDEELENSK